MLTDDQARRLICGVLSALNAVPNKQYSMMATQEHVDDAIEQLKHTQVWSVLEEVSVPISRSP